MQTFFMFMNIIFVVGCVNICSSFFSMKFLIFIEILVALPFIIFMLYTNVQCIYPLFYPCTDWKKVFAHSTMQTKASNTEILPSCRHRCCTPPCDSEGRRLHADDDDKSSCARPLQTQKLFSDSIYIYYSCRSCI